MSSNDSGQFDPRPNPWSREAGDPVTPGGQPLPNPQPAYAQQQPQGWQAQPATQRLSAPRTDQTMRQPDLAAYLPPQTGYAAPPSQPRKKGVGARAAGLVAVALAAAAVGGFGGVAATTYLADGNDLSSAVSNTVVQADPNEPNWTEVAAAAENAVVAIQVEGSGGSGQGSGVVIDAEGHVVTNNHVISSSGGQANLTVIMSGRTYQATVVGTDPSTDLAVIKLVDPPEDLQVIAFGDESKLRVGDPVMAIGNPLGLDGTVTTGIVSALDRPVTTRAVDTNQSINAQSNTVVTAAIQTNAAINPGNSGGALLNSAGELVGITSSIATLSQSSDGGTGGNIGIGFAIPADQVRYVADQLIQSGTAQHPQIGVSATDSQEQGRLGAQIAEVVSGSPAEGAGIQVGDLITAVNGRNVTSTESLVALVRAQRVGEPITLTVVRGGQEQQIELTPVASGR
ncbi:S1C family serine protease [Tessaracoccus caeni]|uniref:S1C family serine protease n=1 Tax=Tessaracoccus caeni TaxID=3031239 RepID=UPI0023DC5A11|nr:trypsin-like peptidase domain-containing protein [Tessaracoccus caeni]MDF1489369.1 trypsin-like peptidase domain-containing protein [Tessaracoccus caeni]